MNGEDARKEWVETAPPSGTIRVATRVTRTRYLELAAFAEELCGWIEAKGVKPNENCQLKRLVENMIDLDK